MSNIITARTVEEPVECVLFTEVTEFNPETPDLADPHDKRKNVVFSI